MMPRLQAEEQLVAINVGRIAQGAGDDKGKKVIERHIDALQSQAAGDVVRAGARKRTKADVMNIAMGIGLRVTTVKE